MPALPDLLGLYQTIFALVVMTLFGRLLLAGRQGIALQLLAGWAALCLLLTLWGISSSASLRFPAAAFVLLSSAAFFLPQTRSWVRWREDLGEVGRLLLLMAPLLWMMADILPSQVDVFNLMLPNAAYLYDHAAFPTQSGPPAFSDLPVAPYNTEIVPFLGTLAGGGFAANGLSLFTLLLHLAPALLYARIVGGGRPGWLALAFGYAMATLLNPGFVPRVSFSGMGEGPLSITLLFVGWLAAEVMEGLAAGVRWPAALWPLMLVLVAMVNIKQQAIGVFVAAVVAMTLVAASDPRIGWRAALRNFGLAALPAIGLFLVWRGYVLIYFPQGELKALPLSAWDFTILPKIVLSMVTVLIYKGYFLASLIAVLVLWMKRKGLGLSVLTRRILAMTGVTFLVFNGYLIAVYIGLFREEHSYFRYTAELSMLIDLGIVLAVRDLVTQRSSVWSARLAGAARALIPLLLLVPLGTGLLLRFDRDMPQPLLRQMAARLAAEVKEGDRIAIMLPGDNDSVAIALGSLLRFGGKVHPHLDLRFSRTAGPADLEAAAEEGYALAFVSCTDVSVIDSPPHSAVLLVRVDQQWTLLKSWPYEPPPPRSRWGWTESLSHQPFCLP